jgi:hypothetical protein
MEFPILICLTFLHLHLHFPTCLASSAKATAVCLFLGFFSFSYFHSYHLFGLLFSFPAGRRYEDDSDTNA